MKMLLLPKRNTMKMKHKQPRQYSFVKFDWDAISKKYRKKYPFTKKSTLVYFGEIPNMPGHCVILNRDNGKIYAGFHIENFIELTEDET